MILEDLSRSIAYKRYLIFSPLTYNGEVTKLTWPKVTDIKNPKYTNCRHLCPYCAMRVSKSSDHWCAFGTMSNFEKTQLEVRSLNATLSRDLWGHRVIVFFGNVSNCWLNSCSKFGGATRRRFFTICEKPYGGLKSPPAGARVNEWHLYFFCRMLV